MKTTHILQTMEAHTGGQPVRLVTSGYPPLPGATQAERQNHAREHCDRLRTALCLEPRSRGAALTAVLTPPASPRADHGILFMDRGGYREGSLHGLICVATMLVEGGLTPVREPETRLVLDQPSGPVTAAVRVEQGRAVSVTVEAPPAMLVRSGIELVLPLVGRFTVDVAWCGRYFAFVDASVSGIDRLTPPRLREIVWLAQGVHRGLVDTDVDLSGPEPAGFRDPLGSDPVMVVGPPERTGAHARGVVVYGAGGAWDRSPGGAGICARLAALMTTDDWPAGRALAHESMTGACFSAVAGPGEPTSAGRAIVPLLTGSAGLLGMNTILIDPDDPWTWGFQVD